MTKLNIHGKLNLRKNGYNKSRGDKPRTIQISATLYKKLELEKIMKDKKGISLKSLADKAIKHSIDDGTI